MSGLYAILRAESVRCPKLWRAINSLISRVEQEDERHDCVCGSVRPIGSKPRGTDGLDGKEDEHADGRPEEECSPADAVDEQASAESPELIPDLQDTVDEQLNRRVRDAD